MANFKISVLNHCNGVTEYIDVVGRKEPKRNIVKFNGKDEAEKNDYYYISKINKLGIKWIIINKNSNRTSDFASNRSIPHYYSVLIKKIS